MGLSLEVKKFINSEQTGEFIELVLPGEITVRRRGKKDAVDDYLDGAPEEGFDADEGVSSVRTDAEPVDGTGSAKDGETVTDADNSGEAAESSEQKPEKKPKPKRQEPESENERVRMHYIEAGDGEPLILVHTVGQSYYTWRKVFERLSEYYHVLAIDLLGHGYSDRPDTFGYTIEEHADSIRLFMDAKGIKSAHFAAFSMGAAYVAQLALQYPERVARMVLLTPGGVTSEMPLAVRMIDSTIFGIFASRLYGMNTVDKMLQETFFDLTNITPDVIQEYYRPASDSEGRRAIRLSLQRFEDEELTRRLRDLQTPTLILQGSEDKWHSAKLAELFHASIKNAGFSLVRNAGHLIQEEKPDKLISAFLEFIPVAMPG